MERDSYQIISFGIWVIQKKVSTPGLECVLSSCPVQISIPYKLGLLNAPSLGDNGEARVMPTSAVPQKSVARDFPLWPEGARDQCTMRMLI